MKMETHKAIRSKHKTIEETINKSSKSRGPGIIGQSLNKGTVMKWTLTSHERAAILTVCKESTGMHMIIYCQFVASILLNRYAFQNFTQEHLFIILSYSLYFE